MAKFPTYEEFGRQCAEYALDEYRYIGRTIREWISLITSTEDETGFDIGAVLMRLRSKDVMCEFCDNYFGEECEAGDVLECASWSAARKAAELIEHLYAENCAKNAEIKLLTRDRDEWKRRAEAVKAKRGYWREWRSVAATRKFGYKQVRYYSCSECECCSAVKSNYCPRCGARMDEHAAEV